MTKRTKPTFVPLSSDDLSEARGALETMLQGGTAQPNPDNPLLAGILASLEDDSLPGYRRGREYTEAELREVPLGTVIWIHYCKDDNPDNERVNGAYMVTAQDNDACGTGAFEVHTGEDWKFDGDTSRGTAYYFVAEPKPVRPNKAKRGRR